MAKILRDTTSRLPSIPVLLSAITLFVLAMIISPFYVQEDGIGAPTSENGVIDISDWDMTQEVMPLMGEWEFYWDQLLKSEKADGATSDYLPMPALWSDHFNSMGANYPSAGVATYRLLIKGLKPGKYQLYFPQLYVPVRVWLDGELSAENGRVGRLPEDTITAWGNSILNFTSDGSSHELLIEVAAHHHRANGFEEPPLLGSEQTMEDHIQVASALGTLFLAILLMLSVYGFCIFFFRPGDRSSLYFAIFCAAFLVPSASFNTNFLSVAIEDLSFSNFLALVYLPGIIAVASFYFYVAELYKEETHRFVSYAVVGVYGLAFLLFYSFFVVGDTNTASVWYPLITISSLVVLIYLLSVILRASWNGRDGALILLLGILFFAVTLANDALVASNMITYDQALPPGLTGLGLVIFLISQAVILAERWSKTLEYSEQMTKDLGQLVEMSSAISSEMNLRDLLFKIVHSAGEFLNSERGSLFLYDEETDELWSFIAEGVGDKEIRFPAEQGVAGACFKSGETINVKDAYKDERFIALVDKKTGFITQSILSMPVSTKAGRRIGVMQVLNKKSRLGFDAIDESRLRAFASQAAIALENATLFTDVMEARNYNDSILSSMSNGVITVGQKNRVEKINESAASILDIDTENDQRVDVNDLFSGQNEWVLEDIKEVNSSLQPLTRVDVDLDLPEGDAKSVNLSVVPLVLEQQNIGSLVLLDDITEEKRVKGTMARFLTKEIADQVLGSDDDLLSGTNYDASIMFSDIRSFTSISESLGPKDTVSLLNHLFTEMVEEIFNHKGVLDKFIGDAIMAVFGAPISSGEDQENSVASAIGIKRSLNRINRTRVEENKEPIRMGIGIASGSVIAGTIGSPKRMEYTVIGDSVNLASRIEGLTKYYDAGILVCNTTKISLEQKHKLREVDLIRVRGQNKPNEIWQVLDYHDEISFPHISDVLEIHGIAMALWKAGDWKHSLEKFEELLQISPQDRIAMIYADRCRNFVKEPPAEDWDGVWNA
ncbi:adenylate/guanylate cyclase domain-containing protein [Parvularcula sp. IMCC14364]|uniref:adenylate/guanylate cyclase domain-containing protein n=1 Tax=Parvularcula sp. IMCC14364 TaxID=3067902 RepID=UPI0027423DFF|nr:adenylate/guanylate cyclase domain-containing protein [Parvularcula sp. IMCC14364]